MVIHAHVRNGVVIPDEPVALPEGAEVRLEIVSLPAIEEGDVSGKRRQGGWWKGQVSIADDFDTLPDELVDAFGMRSP